MQRVRVGWGSSILLPLLLAFAACEDTVTGIGSGEDHPLQPGYALLPADSDLTLNLEAETFAAGQTVSLVLSNGTDQRVGFNMCFHVVEQLTDGDWERVTLDQGRICTLIHHSLDPGGSATYHTSIPSALGPGEYRFRIAVTMESDQEFRDQVSPSFALGD